MPTCRPRTDRCHTGEATPLGAVQADPPDGRRQPSTIDRIFLSCSVTEMTETRPDVPGGLLQSGSGGGIASIGHVVLLRHVIEVGMLNATDKGA